MIIKEAISILPGESGCDRQPRQKVNYPALNPNRNDPSYRTAIRPNSRVLVKILKEKSPVGYYKNTPLLPLIHASL